MTDLSTEQQAALDDYWAATTPAAAKEAYARMMALGMPDAYASEDSEMLLQMIKRLRAALAYAIAEADGWHDDALGGPVDTPEMDDARKLAGVIKP